MPRIISAILLLLWSASWRVTICQDRPSNDPVTISIAQVRGTYKFTLLADKAWRNISGPEQTLRDLTDSLRKNPEVINKDSVPDAQTLERVRDIVIEKQHHNIQLSDCEAVAAIRGAVESYVAGSRPIIWKGGFVQCFPFLAARSKG